MLEQGTYERRGIGRTVSVGKGGLGRDMADREPNINISMTVDQPSCIDSDQTIGTYSWQKANYTRHCPKASEYRGRSVYVHVDSKISVSTPLFPSDQAT